MSNKNSDKKFKGMTVHDANGAEIGTVSDMEGSTLIVEYGPSLKKRALQLSDIISIAGTDIRVRVQAATGPHAG